MQGTNHVGLSKKKLGDTYNEGMKTADARSNPSSFNYKSGFDKGYSDGRSQGRQDVTLAVNGRRVTASNGKTADVAYTGNNGVVSVSTSGGSGNQTIDIADGYATSVVVDRTNAYNKGVTDADNRVNTSSASYTSGRTQGQNDVKANPNNYLSVKRNVTKTHYTGPSETSDSYTATSPCLAIATISNGYNWADQITVYFQLLTNGTILSDVSATDTGWGATVQRTAVVRLNTGQYITLRTKSGYEGSINGVSLVILGA